MGEYGSKEEKSPVGTKGISRRKFLGALLGGAATVALATKETQAAQEGIDTPHGTFIPLYEEHIEGLFREDVPDDLDILFKEYGWSTGYDVDPKTLLTQVASGGYAGSQKTNGGEKIIEKLAQNGTRMMFADIEVPNASSSILVTAAGGLAGLLAEMGLVTRYVYTQSEGLEKQQDQSNTVPDRKLTRRALLKGVLKGAFHTAAAWAAAPLVTSIFTYGAGILDQQNALRRIITRINGLQSHLHPEQAVTFFRNAVIADKLLTVAEAVNKEEQRKPKIGFNVGAGHSGIEDFLKLGPEFCRFIVTSYPKEFLENVMQVNGGMGNFSSIRLLELPKDLKAEDLKDVQKVQNIEEKRIYDEELLTQLQAKLGTS